MIVHFRCTSVGLLRAGSGVVRWGVGKQGGGKGLADEQDEGGSACMVRSMRRPDTLKGRSLLVARLQASQVVGLIHCPWLRCLCASVCRSVSYLNPADAGSV